MSCQLLPQLIILLLQLLDKLMRVSQLPPQIRHLSHKVLVS